MWRAESRCCSLWARLPDSGLGSVLGSEVLLSHGRVWQTPLGALQLVPPSQRVCRSLQCNLPPSSAHVSTSIHSNDARRILLYMLLILNSLEITFSFPFFCITFPIYARVSPESSSNQLQKRARWEILPWHPSDRAHAAALRSSTAIMSAASRRCALASLKPDCASEKAFVCAAAKWATAPKQERLNNNETYRAKKTNKKHNMEGINNDESALINIPKSCFQLLTGLFKWLIHCISPWSWAWMVSV